ncbi:hypothetical protein, partial [Salmonella sp. E393-2]|uniref:hypothetical protein n=1 Tax=Salmonella sp. E393-2 TaxID=3240324 RepID=UPI00352AD0E7
LGRFVFRRVLPVAVGITGYAAMKRAGYIAKVPGVEWTGPMQGLTVESYEAMKGVGDHLKLFGKNAWREGKATATFGVLWMA